MFAMNHINSGFVRGRRDASRKATALAVAAIALLTVCLLQLPAVSGTGPAVAFAADVPGSTSDAAASIGSATALATSADLADGQDTPLVLVWRDELVFRVLGSDFGRVELELHRSADGLAKFIDQTYYDAQATEIVTEWIFGQDAAAPALKLYSFSVETPAGNLDARISFADEVTYEVVQTGGKGTLSQREVDPAISLGRGSRLTILPLDNNALADYLVPTWFLSSEQAGEGGLFGLVLPINLPQHQLVLDANVKYLGIDKSLGIEAFKYSVSVGGVPVSIWTTPHERRLIKLEIQSQGVEIINEALLAQSTDGPEAESQPIDAALADGDESVLFVESEVEVPAKGGYLAATLLLPAKVEGEVPGVVIVAGSGPTDRDGNNPLIPGEVNTYREIAEYLSSRGIAVLRYDKRGIAQSALLAQGETPPFEQYAEDVTSCVEYLKSVDGVSGDAIFIAGHSEGGVLALMAAASGTDVAGLILLSTPGYPLRDTLRSQIEAQADVLESAGMAGIKEKMLTALDDLYEAVKTDGPFDYTAYDLPEQFAATYLSLDMQREFARGFLFADPAELASRTDLPVCIIQGTGDTQVTEDNALVLAAALGDQDVEVYIIEGMDHVLKPTQGEPLPYGDPSRRVSVEVLEAIERFVVL
jgi:alpha-beta hydrolase superfamily lysophospholipase